MKYEIGNIVSLAVAGAMPINPVYCCHQCGRGLVLDPMKRKISEPLFAIAYPKIEHITFYCKFHADEKWRWLTSEFPDEKTGDPVFLHTSEYEEYAAALEVVNG